MEVTFKLNIEQLMSQFESLRSRDGVGFMLGEFARNVRLVMMDRSPYDGFTKQGKAKGLIEHTKGSWMINVNSSGDVFTALIGTDRPYATVLENGGYRGLGPRTAVGTGGGIFSRQAVGGMIAPMIEDEKGMSNIFEASASSIEKLWGMS